MCTVTYIPQRDGFILTSNRDEKVGRATIPPETYIRDGSKIMYPKDKKAGGTWIAANENGTCIVLLNGAFNNHHKKQNYRKSRGAILLEAITAENVIQHFTALNLSDIEPFTLICVQNNQLTELKWDESHKHIIEHSASEAHIWSSSTLYNTKQSNLRKRWFKDFIDSKTSIDEDTIRFFHTHTKPENTDFGLLIDRADRIKTVSISQLISARNKIAMSYVDRTKNLPLKKTHFV